MRITLVVRHQAHFVKVKPNGFADVNISTAALATSALTRISRNRRATVLRGSSGGTQNIRITELKCVFR
jgi:hypothetical protein